MSTSSTIEKLKKAIQVLESPHVQAVQVGFEYSDGNTRYYSAITEKTHIGKDLSVGVVQHRYRVRCETVFNEMTGETQLEVRCNCAAGAKNAVCRHALKIREVEADEFNRSFALEAAFGYQAFSRSRRVF